MFEIHGFLRSSRPLAGISLRTRTNFVKRAFGAAASRAAEQRTPMDGLHLQLMKVYDKHVY
jgi:hypothetical protein